MENKLPKNWVKTELGNYAILKNGYAFKSNDFQNEGLPVVKISNIKDFKIEIENAICVGESKLKPDFIIAKGDILIAMSGATTGKYGVFEQDVIALQNQRVGNLKPVVESLSNRRFLLYLLGSLKEEIEEKAYGAAQPNISPKLIESIKIYLPPLAEQNRIVAKLDALFAQHEAIKTSMAKIPELLKNFRQQVLTQAVTGKLTEEWRKGKELDEWRFEEAKKCCEKVQSGGTPKGSNFALSGIPFLKVYNIVNNKIDFEYNPQYVTEEIQYGQIKKSITYPNDVIMNIVGPPLNKVAIIPDDYPEWNLNQAITIFRVKEYMINKFLYYFFCEGSSVKSLINETKGVVGQVNISLSQCRDFQIPIPSIKEQQEIINRVESLFTKADAIEQHYKNLKTKIDTLPQAILHKAFKGELTEQLASDGDAKELLKEIMKLKEERLGKKKPKAIKAVSKKVKLYREKEEVLGKVAED